MRRIPPLYLRTAIQFQPAAWFFQLEYLGADRQDRLSGGDISDHRIAVDGTPAWNVLNFRMAYKIPLGYTNSNLQLRAGINNLLNEAYRMHGSGVDGMGLSFWYSASWVF